MGKAKDIAEVKKAEIRALIQNTTMSIHEISRRTEVSSRTVRRIRDSIGNFQISTNLRQNCGRHRCTSLRDDAILRRSTRKAPWKSATEHAIELREEGIGVGKRTVCRRLNESGFHYVTPVRKPFLTPAMKRKRLAWAKEHQNWTIDDWKKVRSFIFIKI